jgi:hypothetical protein
MFKKLFSFLFKKNEPVQVSTPVEPEKKCDPQHPCGDCTCVVKASPEVVEIYSGPETTPAAEVLKVYEEPVKTAKKKKKEGKKDIRPKKAPAIKTQPKKKAPPKKPVKKK